ncbi:radical SAM protein [Nocardia tengchongensis]|uniref:radical SAM protein n=1 Tax=Nocardia tengchongensis TaxID=2055889 RepID=UPI0036CA4988
MPILSVAEQDQLREELRDVIEYRKSGLSLNWIVGCPLDCGYCVRHLFDNYEMKVPRALMSDDDAAKMLLGNHFFQPHITPIQLLNRATDPMLPRVKPHTLNMLRLLDEQKLTNHVLVISRWHIGPEDCAILNSFKNIRLTILVTNSGIDHKAIEPVDSNIAAKSLRTAFENAERYRVIHYWRPIVPGLNDSDEHLRRGLGLTNHAHATVFTGLFYKAQIQEYFKVHGLPEPYDEGPRRKILPETLEERILTAARTFGTGSPLFRKTSCAVTYAHEVADYNGHFGIRELCDICPVAQLKRCEDAWRRPNDQEVDEFARRLGGELVEINNRSIVVSGLSEQPRYLMQHSLGYQVHDVARPHIPNHHGRADLGWPTIKEPQ